MQVYKYSLWTILKAYKENEAYLKNYKFGAENSVEFYGDSKNDVNNAKAILGLSIGAFMTLLIIYIVLFIWGLIALIQNANRLETWAIVLAVIFLLIGFPVGTLLVVYIARKPEYKFMF
jgi:hypothetical protein